MIKFTTYSWLLLAVNCTALLLVFLWKGWIGILLFMLGELVAVCNKVVLNAQKGEYD